MTKNYIYHVKKSAFLKQQLQKRTTNRRGVAATTGQKRKTASLRRQEKNMKTMLREDCKSISKRAEEVFEPLGATKMSASQSTRSMVKGFVKQQVSVGSEDPFIIVDLSSVARRALNWKRLMPRVELFYAVKCNPNPNIVRLLFKMGCNFDCASLEEIKLVRDVMEEEVKLNPAFHLAQQMGDRIIFANPCKQTSHMKYARENHVKMVTADNEFEITKFKQFWPEAEIVIRIKTDDKNSVCAFSSKFGATISVAKKMIQQSKELGLNVVGVSFHVGSNCKDPSTYASALDDSKTIFDFAAQVGYDFKLIDIGGGYPGKDSQEVTFEHITKVVNEKMEQHFADSSIRVIGEPGRYMVTECQTLATNICAKRDQRLIEEGHSQDFLYYVNEGVYGTFNNIYFDHMIVNESNINILKKKRQMKKPLEPAPRFSSTIWGPTCDSVDKLCYSIPLQELDIGDWLFFSDLGAYTSCCSTNFNGFKLTKFFYVYKC